MRLYFTLVIGVISLLSTITGCALRQGETRKIIAWGIWAAPLGQPIGIGYWHSERGDDVKGEESSKPGLPTATPLNE